MKPTSTQLMVDDRKEGRINILQDELAATNDYDSRTARYAAKFYLDYIDFDELVLAVGQYQATLILDDR